MGTDDNGLEWLIGEMSTSAADPNQQAAPPTVAAQAVDAVLADFARTGNRGEPQPIWIHFAMRGNHNDSSIAEVMVEVAEDFQEYHSQEVFCWPECVEHNAGLWALEDNGVAVWWCKQGNHRAAQIGHLGE